MTQRWKAALWALLSQVWGMLVALIALSLLPGGSVTGSIVRLSVALTLGYLVLGMMTVMYKKRSYNYGLAIGVPHSLGLCIAASVHTPAAALVVMAVVILVACGAVILVSAPDKPATALQASSLQASSEQAPSQK